MGDGEESEEHDPSVSLHEDISLSWIISREWPLLDDEVATRGDSGVSGNELAWSE